ncbi:dTMP kinase [uncultured Rikenella sp.]|uniref:dTMP kinase n=1 Tax=uncultured Rikenella sp. TaxID=368003 RepID=UPI0025D4E9DB|nr:dTMP kinase [uncultured Rikenella sp.]
MFIVIEGLDGAGKSTQVGLMRRLFEERYRQHVEYLHFPRFAAPVYGELIARFLRGELGELDQVDPYLVALLYAGDRQEAASTIRSWLDSGKVVIVDRYVYSNIAYQCAKLPAGSDARSALKQWILDLEYSHNGIPRPDLSLFLDVPFAFTARKLAEQRQGDDRSYLNGKQDIHEASLDLQQRVREVYLDCAAGDPSFRVIDCADPATGGMLNPDLIFQKIDHEIARHR